MPAARRPGRGCAVKGDRRAPPDAKSPSLTHNYYKLTMCRDADIPRAVADYGRNPGIEYAEPNAIATIQPETAGVQ